MSVDEQQQDEKRGRDILFEFYQELETVSGNPRSMIIITNAFLELLIDTLIERDLSTSDIILDNRQAYPYSVRITFIQEKQLLPEKLCDHLRRFNSLRNEAAHDIRFYNKAETTTYIKDKIALIVQYYNLEKEADLRRVITWITGDTWNQHPTFFHEKLGGG